MSLTAAFKPLPAGAGPVGLLSSDEFSSAVAAFDRALLAHAGPRVALITAADPTHAERNARIGIDHFVSLGGNAFHLPTPLPDELPACDLIYLAGGDPRVLLETLHDDPGWARVLDAWRAGTGLAGSSAGAMALCEHCLVPEPGGDKPTRWTDGLGPLEGVGVAVHAATRPSGWLRDVSETSRSPVIALDDATGVVLTNTDEPVVIGRGRVWVAR